MKVPIFFPPRLIEGDTDVGDWNAMLDDARDRYLKESIAILGDEDSIKDAQKIINFYKSFSEILPPT